MTKKKERFVITTAQMNAKPNFELLDSIKTYLVTNDAELLILPTIGTTLSEEEVLHPIFSTEQLVLKERSINTKLKIKDFGVRPQQINPLTGLERLAQGDRSFIMPGTKQVLQYVANSHNDLPKALMTTGAITHPHYRSQFRIGRIAEHDHEYGFVVVEKVNGTTFHFRHVTSLKNGKFSDLGQRYDGGNVVEHTGIEALVVGDLHPYDTDPIHERITSEQLTTLTPKMVVLHDTFNGKSISHHYKGKNKDRYDAFKLQGLDLGAELELTGEKLRVFSDKVGDGLVYIVRSNHDEHLDRYLDEGRFINDKGNDKLGAQLYVKRLEGANTLQAGIELVSGVLPKNIVFLNIDDDLKVLGYQLGNHGHYGANGGKGSPRSIEAANGKSIVGHGHGAYKIRNTYRVGTSTFLSLSYNHGYSGWTQTNGVLHQDGTVQLINTINKQWRMK